MFGKARVWRAGVVRTLAVSTLGLAAFGAVAQSFADLAMRNDPGRRARITEAARREGSVTFYTSIPEKDMTVLAADFEKRYGVKVQIWRASTVKVLQRTNIDESWFGIIYTLDEGDIWHDPTVWRKANPNYGVSVRPDDMEAAARKAQAMPSALANL